MLHIYVVEYVRSSLKIERGKNTSATILLLFVENILSYDGVYSSVCVLIMMDVSSRK